MKYNYFYNISIIYNIMDKSLQTFFGIMLFYAILSFVIGPVIFYFFWKKSLKVAGYGFIVGSILSIILWLSVGEKMVMK